MEIAILHGPGNSAAKIKLRPQETCTAEAGAMIAASEDISITTSVRPRGGGGLLRAASRVLAGESLFLNVYTAGPRGGEVFLAADLPGDMMRYDLDRENLVVQAGSFVACDSSITMNLGWEGFKSLFSGESLFWIHLSGLGPVVLSSFGAIYPVDVDGEYLVDTGHIVAFQETLDFTITKPGKSWVGAFLGGEGFVCKFHGRGTVWCQSHNAAGFGEILGPMLKSR